MTRPAIHEDPALPIHAYLDGELDPKNALEIERRMAEEPALAAACERIEALQGLIRRQLPRETAPEGLRLRVENAVGIRPQRRQLSSSRFSDARFSWRALAASIVLTAFVAGGSGTLVTQALRTDPAGSPSVAIVDAHIRSLMAAQPIDVASSDRHTVKPWFNGRIPQAPRVVDLAAAGFPLVGGRIDVVAEVPVPTLVYHHAKHVISLTALPAPAADAAPTHRAVSGYNIERWTADGVMYWAVSDVAAGDLAKFAELFRTTPPDQ